MLFKNTTEKTKKFELSNEDKAMLKSAIILASGLAIQWLNQVYKKTSEANEVN